MEKSLGKDSEEFLEKIFSVIDRLIGIAFNEKKYWSDRSSMARENIIPRPLSTAISAAADARGFLFIKRVFVIGWDLIGPGEITTIILNYNGIVVNEHLASLLKRRQTFVDGSCISSIYRGTWIGVVILFVCSLPITALTNDPRFLEYQYSIQESMINVYVYRLARCTWRIAKSHLPMAKITEKQFIL